MLPGTLALEYSFPSPHGREAMKLTLLGFEGKIFFHAEVVVQGFIHIGKGSAAGLHASSTETLMLPVCLSLHGYQ